MNQLVHTGAANLNEALQPVHLLRNMSQIGSFPQIGIKSFKPPPNLQHIETYL